jgi:drug/metabolite transporter (DMT)-like permease
LFYPNIQLQLATRGKPALTVIFGILAALAYGVGDFFGALASKKIRALSATASALFIGLGAAILMSFVVGAEYSNSTIIGGGLAGLASAVAIALFYAAMALGPIAIITTITTVVAATVPLAYDLLIGEPLKIIEIAAIGLLIFAGALVGFVPGSEVKLPSGRAALYAVGAGMGFSAFFIFLDATPPDSGLASLVMMRLTGAPLLLLGLFLVWLKNRPAPMIEPELRQPRIAAMVAAAGVLDVFGNVFFLSATRAGALSISAVLASMGLVFTILMARLILKERLAGTQSMGIAIAIFAIVLLTIA